MTSDNLQDTAPALDLNHELEEALKIWAHAQAPEKDFGRWRMFAFNVPVRLENGLFFNRGELALCRRAPERAQEFAQVGLPAPIVLWSFAQQGEQLMNPALVTLETDPFDPELVPEQAAAHSDGPGLAA